MSQRFGGEAEEIVNISLGFVFSTVAMCRAVADNSGVKRTLEWRDSRLKHVDHGPNDSLSRQCRGAVSETEGCVDVELAAPTYGEEDGCDGVQDKLPVPPGKVQLEDKDSLPGVPGADSLDTADNGL